MDFYFVSFFVALETLIVEYPSLIQLVIINYMRLYKDFGSPPSSRRGFPPA